MGISIYKIKKWYKMMTGNSISHVNQGVGKCYSKTEVAGYYNDLTEKITKDDPDILVPKYCMETGEKIYFSIGCFQYGLAAYDLYLSTHEQVYLDKLLACTQWALENQQDNGGWITFAHKHMDHPYSAMAQGEGISMLIRAHIVTKDEKILNAINKAKDFMLKPISEGGTTEFIDGEVYLYEDTNSPLILNGWIFSIWGLYDYCKYIKDIKTQKVLSATVISLQKKLPDFDVKYWSKYEDGPRISSPFYHKLHVEQMKVMYDLFDGQIFYEFASKWEAYRNSFWKPKIAFVIKAKQKIFE